MSSSSSSFSNQNSGRAPPLRGQHSLSRANSRSRSRSRSRPSASTPRAHFDARGTLESTLNSRYAPMPSGGMSIRDSQGQVTGSRGFAGTFQTTLERSFLSKFKDIEPDLAAAGSAYLNPGHLNNSTNAVPLPDGTPGRTFVFRSLWNENVTLTNDNAMFYNLPFFEAPFGYLDNTIGKIRTFVPPGSVSGAVINPAAYMATHGIYKYRCLGKSMTITDQTPVIQRQGSVLVARKPADVDSPNRSFLLGNATDASNQRILQALPQNVTQASALAGTIADWKSELGVYLVSHHSDHDWVVRDGPLNKAWPNAQFNDTYVNGKLTATVPGTGVSVPVIPNGYPAISCINVGPTDHTDIAMASFTECSANETKLLIKCCVVYEFQLKADSDLLPYTSIRPQMDRTFMDALITYESSIAVGGFVADANAWSDIWNGFKKFWKRGGGTLTRVGLDALAPGAGMAAGSIGDILTQL